MKYKPQLKSEIAKFAYHVADNIRMGLQNRLQVFNGYDYQAKLHNGKRVIVIKLSGFPSDKLDKLLSMEKQITIDSGLPESSKIRISFGSNRTAIIEVGKPKLLRNNVYTDDLIFDGGNPYNIPVGLDTADKQVNIDFSDPMSAHMLISGLTGSGKTVAQSYIAHSIMNSDSNAGFIMFDAVKRGINFENFDNHPSLLVPVIKDNEAAIDGLALVKHLIDNGSTGQHDRIFVVVDELKFLAQDTDNGMEVLSRVAALGRQFGIHLLLATQYPQKQLLGGKGAAAELVDNIGIMLCGKVKNAAMSTNALGMPNMGAEKLGGNGEFILVDSERTGVRVVFPWFEIDEIEPCPSRTYPIFETEKSGASKVKTYAASDSGQTFTVPAPVTPVDSKGPGRPPNLDRSEWLTVNNVACRLLILNSGKITQGNLIKSIKRETGIKVNYPQAKEIKESAKDFLRVNWTDHGIKFYTNGAKA